MSIGFLPSCSSVKTGHQREESIVKPNSCYVKWSRPENKEKYDKGLGLKKEEKKKQSLLISILDNESFFVLDELSPNIYLVRYSIGKNLMFVLADEFNSLDEYKPAPKYLTYKTGAKEIKESIQGFELVDCHQYLDSLTL